MAFTYHPPTRSDCLVCQRLLQDDVSPLIGNGKGKASSADDFPVHNWYNFVLGYTPEFPNYILEKECIASSDLVIDPFMGAGTTLVCCKLREIPSKGMDANDFMVDAARAKLYWSLNTGKLRKNRDELLGLIFSISSQFAWEESSKELASRVQSTFWDESGKPSFRPFARQLRPKMLIERYMSDKPFAKAKIIEEAINKVITDSAEKEFFDLALASVLIPISNVRYGPGFGVVRPKDDADVFRIFTSKVDRMIRDLECLTDSQKATPTTVVLGDTRQLTDFFGENIASLMITSPPYPGDHEYTKYTRLELAFQCKANNVDDFRTIKRRMLQASTTNIYRDLDDGTTVTNLESVKLVTDLIKERLEHDKATSGFEKLYTKLVWQYFGGMHKSLKECLKILKPRAKIALLVSDSHAFKMVHIQTAEILKEIGMNLGYTNPEIILWQLKTSTSHKYYLRENILVMQKPDG